MDFDYPYMENNIEKVRISNLRIENCSSKVARWTLTVKCIPLASKFDDLRKYACRSPVQLLMLVQTCNCNCSVNKKKMLNVTNYTLLLEKF